MVQRVSGQLLRRVLRGVVLAVGIAAALYSATAHPPWVTAGVIGLFGFLYVMERWAARADAARSAAAAALAESEAGFRHLAEHAPDIIYRYRFLPTPGYEFVSPAATEVTGYTPEEYYADPELGRKLVIPDDRPRLDRALADPQVVSHPLALRYRRKDGAIRWIEQHNRAIYDAAGRMVALEGIGRDITAQRLQDEQLRVLRRAMEESPISAILTDRDGTIVYVNRKACVTTGYTNEELVGRTPRVLKSGETPPDVYRQLWTTITGGGQWQGEFHNRRKDGTLYWEFATISPVTDANGEITQFLALKEDVTERKAAVQELQASEERYRLLFERNPFPMWTFDPETLRFLAVNDAAVRTYGFSRDEFLAMTIRDIRPPEELPRLDSSLRTGFADLESQVWRHRKRDGSVIDVEVVAHGITVDGRRARLVLAHDVTERQRVDAALRTSEASYRTLVEQSPYGIYRVAADGRLLMVNRAMVEMLGYASADDLLRRNLGTDIYAEPADRARILAQVEAGDAPPAVEVLWRRRDGSRVAVRLNAKPLQDDQGRLTMLEGVVEDITERRNLEEQLRQAQKMEALGQLAGGVAHDFNNLLTTISAATELVRTDLPEDSRLHPDLDAITNAAQRGAELTRGLLAFGRRQTLDIKIVSLNDLLAGFVRLARRLVREDIQLAVLPCEGDILVRADAGALEQILMNLVTNARDAMAHGGTIALAVQRTALDADFCARHGWGEPGSYGLITVSDSGVGMDAEVLRRIYEPFFTTKPVGAGTGLGMAMVYGLVKQHQAFVNVYSEPGHGTTVRLYLPAGEGVATSRRTPMQVALPRGTETILLVEDEDMLRRTAQRVLERHGYQVRTAANGAEALERYLADERAIDLIVSDVVMPLVTGPAFVAELRRRGKTPRVVFTSGYTARDVEETSTLDAATPFVAKPWTMADLLTTIREVLNRPDPA